MNEIIKFVGFAGGALVGFYAMNRAITRFNEKK